MNHRCDNCGRITPENEQMYMLRLEMFARADPLEFTEEDLLDSNELELEELVEQMEHLDAGEATDEVHEAYQFELCTRCRRHFHSQLQQHWVHKKSG